MSKIAGEINAEMLKNNKVIHDKRRILFAEMVKQTGSQQSVLDCLLQEIESLRQQLVTITNKLENASATADAFQNVIQQADEDIGILRRQRDELLTALKKQVAKDKAVSYERCFDCDFPKKCSRETGCLCIKDHSPIANAAISATKEQGK